MRIVDESIHDPIGQSSYENGQYRPEQSQFNGKYTTVTNNSLPPIGQGRYWYSNNGYVLMKARNGRYYRGSGCLITPRIVLTAGHVVFSSEDGGAAVSVDFTANYPFNRQAIDASRIYVMPKWVQKSELSFDLAMIYLDEPIATDGFHGVVINSPYEKAKNHHGWTAVGYPASLPTCNNCVDMIVDGGPKSKRAFQYPRNLYFRNGFVAWSRADLTGGASGGPWISNNSAPSSRIGKVLLPGLRGARLYAPLIGSVNSFIRSNKKNIMYGPDFKASHGNFIQAVINDTVIDPT
ncbi:trypsin-like serine protease [Parasphingorhabdus sp.]|uniref:trypsin-like serine peptidase n=1 Tax=Parasphingorhabdus sp. TaxID=2709688 RepID=UPI0032993DE5